MMRKRLLLACGLTALLFVAACVTVNVYFPAAQVEKVADEIVRDVYANNPDAPLPEELTQSQTAEAPTPDADQTATEAQDQDAVSGDEENTDSQASEERDLNSARTPIARILAAMNPFAVSIAMAQDVNAASNAAIRGLRAQIIDNFQKLLPYYNSGVIGINNAGLVEIRKTSDLSMADLAALKGLVNKDNTARRALYQEVATALNIPGDQVSKVQKSFADQWRDDAPSGWQIQTDSGAWVTK